MAKHSDTSSDSSPSVLRRVLVWGGSLLGGLAVLVLVAALLLPRFFTSEELKGYVIPPMEEATGREVEIDDIGLRVLPRPAIRVSGFRLANAEGYGPAPAVEAQALNVDLALWPLFVGTIRPTAVALVKPVVRYEVAEDGTTNFDDLGGPADTTTAEGPPFGGIPVSNFRVSGARLDYADRATGQSLRLDFDAQLDALPEGSALTSGGTVDVRSVRAVLPSVGDDTLSVQDATVTYEVRVVPSEGHVELRMLQLDTAPLTLAAAGTLSGLNEQPTVDLTMETESTDLAEIAAFVPAASRQLSGLNPQGTLDLEATVTGPLSDSLGVEQGLSLTASGQLTGGGIDYEGAALLRDLSAELSLSLDTAAVRSIKGTLLEKSIEGQVAVHDLQGTPQVEGHLAGAADLAVLSALAGEEEGGETSSIRGTADYDVRFAGPAGTPDALRPTGEIRLANVQYPTATLRHPINIPQATVRLTGTGLSMNRSTIRSGNQTVSLQATLRTLFPISEGLAERDPAVTASFTLNSDRLDLVELYPEADTSAVYYSQLFAAHLSGGTVNGQSPDALAEELYGGIELPPYAVDGRVEIGTLLSPPQRYDDLAFDVQMEDRRLALRSLTASTYGGQLAGSLTLDQRDAAGATGAGPEEGSVLLASRALGIAPGSRGTSPPSSALTYDLQLQDANTGAVLADWTALGRMVTGTLTLDVDGETPLTEGLLPRATTLRAVGQSIVSNGGLSLNLGPANVLVEKLGLPASSLKKFQRFGGPFQIEEGQLQMKTWTLGSDRFDAQVQGALGLGGALDLKMTMDVPLSVLQDSKIPSLVGGTDSQLGRVVKKLAGGEAGDETVPVTVGVGGTMREPTVQVINRDAITSRIQSIARDAGLDLLRGLFDSGGGE